MPLGCLASLFGIKEKPAAPTPEASRSVPEHLPVSTKRYFFSPDENQFFRSLETALEGTTYRVFPNVRLSDLFKINTGLDKSEYASVRGRLKDRHVDFLVVDAGKDFAPVLALELDGTSHQQEKQQHSDAVKDVVFRSAGLKLLRVPSRKYSTKEVQQLLNDDLKLP